MKNIYIYIYICVCVCMCVCVFYRSGDSVVNIMTTLRAERNGVRFPVGEKLGLSFTKRLRPPLGPTQPSVERVLGLCPLR